MRKLIIIFLLIPLWGSCQREVLGINKNGRDQVTQPVLIITWGESNSGGYADNGFASGDELAPRTLPILNNNTLLFQPLDVGTNNLIGHTGLTCCTTHGMEIGLANAYEDGDFEGHPVYLVKVGQGGSTIAEWETTDDHYDTMVVRLNAAIEQILELTGQVPKIFVWGSIGINDRIAGTTTGTFKTAYKQFITDIRATINGITGQSHVIPFLFTRFDSMPTNLAYETIFGEIDSEVSDCYAVSTLGADLKDGNHWQYAGFILFVPSFITITITYL